MCWMCVQNERQSYGYGGGVNRRSWNSKSAAATKRQNDAVNKFLEVRKRHEATCKGKEGLILLLTPAEHLTGACYTTFRKKVAEASSYAKRWEVLRTVATEEEKKSYKITEDEELIGKTDEMINEIQSSVESKKT